MRARIKLYTGPIGVSETAEKFRAAGWRDVLEGTEHIHATTPEGFDFRGWGAIEAEARAEDLYMGSTRMPFKRLARAISIDGRELS